MQNQIKTAKFRDVLGMAWGTTASALSATQTLIHSVELGAKSVELLAEDFYEETKADIALEVIARAKRIKEAESTNGISHVEALAITKS